MADDSNPSNLNIEGILKQATTHLDGGFVFSGLIGNGDSFVMRDAHGIRPCYYYQNDEIVVAASERAAIMTAFNVTQQEVKKLEPGHALIVSAAGDFSNVEILPPKKHTA